ncbi:MAG: electron transport complex subunit RsxC [Sulfuricellaceae bacterium]|jgi:electron transport complex protein RnfC
MRTLYTFHGGIHPPEHKTESNRQPIAQAPVPRHLVVSLRQHMGAPAKPLVQPGDKVLKGQLIGEPVGFISAAVHAPTSGTVTAVEPMAVPHPSGLPDLCVAIEADGEDRWAEHAPIDYKSAPPQAVLDHIRNCGVVGLGGAVFPTHIKLQVNGKLETLVINAAECEPWITSDDLLMRERADEIAQGIEILQHLLQPAETLVGIEDNKPEAIAAMTRAAEGKNIDVVAVPTLYPTGGEKQLIKILTGKEVPSGGRPYQIGVVCTNVATVYSVHLAVNLGEPMISRIVTVTGNVRQPGNFEARIGTSVDELLQLAGGPLPDTNRYIMGGPMMGTPLPNSGYHVQKASNCFIAASDVLFPPEPAAMPCTRCTHCAEACPVNLRPYELHWFIRGKNFDKARAYNVFDCIECGCCSYVCSSNIPLVQYFRYAKSELMERDREKRAAEMARQRSEMKQQRLEREKAEKAAKHAAAAAAAAKSETAEEKAAKQAAIAAAVERAKAKKAEAEPQNTENLSPAVQAEIAAVEERRAKSGEAVNEEA